MVAVQAAAAQKFRQVSSACDCDCFRTARTCTAAPTEAGYASRKRKCPRLEASRALSHACQASQGPIPSTRHTPPLPSPLGVRCSSPFHSKPFPLPPAPAPLPHIPPPVSRQAPASPPRRTAAPPRASRRKGEQPLARPLLLLVRLSRRLAGRRPGCGVDWPGDF
jgi:hypothetical protein